MKVQYLGDSYDFVKRALLEWLRALGGWVAHPMFSEAFSRHQTKRFRQLIRVPLIVTTPITGKESRGSFVAAACACKKHLFLDPDTGVRLEPFAGSGAAAYVFGPELVKIATSRPHRLILVFDQSLSRGKEPEQLAGKLVFLQNHGLHGFGYRSHVSFLILGKDRRIVRRARRVLGQHLPLERFMEGVAA